ncbi:MAG: DUF2528 family protein [Flavobacteriaceae bacterium]
MIRTYEYQYNWGEAQVKMQIDDEKLSKDDCKDLLNFFTWKWDKEADPYDELARLYCRTAIVFATANFHNTYGVLRDFEEAEGYPNLDGTYGITLVDVEGIDLHEIELEKVE